MIEFNTGLWIGLRYLGSRRGDALSLATVISTLGLVLSVAVLILVMSVMNGLFLELRSRLLGVVPHIEILHDQLATLNPQEHLDDQSKLPPFSVSPFIRFEALAKGDHLRYSQAITVIGVDPDAEGEGSLVPEHINSGDWDDLATGGGMIMGDALADYLGLFVGAKVTLLFLDQPYDKHLPHARQMTFQVVGLFSVGAEVDYSLAFIDLGDALKSLPETAYRGGWSFRLSEPLDAPELAPLLGQMVRDATGLDTLKVRTWVDVFGSLFQALRLEKVLMFLLLMLIIALSTFSIAATQALSVDQKRPAIAILTTMGMSPAGIIFMFLIQSLVIAMFGIGLGLVAGIGLSEHVGILMGWLEAAIDLRLLENTFFESLPAVWQWGDLMLIAGVALLLTLASTLYPAFRATRLPPASILNRLH